MTVQNDLDALRHPGRWDMHEVKFHPTSLQIEGERPRIIVTIASHHPQGRPHLLKLHQRSRGANVAQMPDLIGLFQSGRQIIRVFVVSIGKNGDAHGGISDTHYPEPNPNFAAACCKIARLSLAEFSPHRSILTPVGFSMKRIVRLVFQLILAGFFGFACVEQLPQALGFSPLPPPYRAQVIRYDEDGYRSRRPIVEVQHADGSKFTFGAGAVRHRRFAIGESIGVVYKPGPYVPSYEIDDPVQRFGDISMAAFLFFLSGGLFCLDFYRWRNATKGKLPNTTSPQSPSM